MSRTLKQLAEDIAVAEADVVADVAPLEQRLERPVLKRHRRLGQQLCDG